ncbi:MAG: heme ABC transporter permease CcmB [Bacteroidetes bacterium]|jgi:heme exporter protein B|nr:heme ABC transporter permease CcmB [Bacteroidota bacterium]
MLRWLHGAWAVFEKDIKLELRSRYAINTMLLFVLSALFLTAFAVGQETLTPRIESALLWIVIVFAAALGLGRSFVSEQERGTVLLLLLHTQGGMVYAGKLLFNFLFVLGLNLLAVATFVLLLGVQVTAPGLLLTTLVLGALGLAGATTLLAAIIARTATRGPLLPVLVFPMLIPLLLAVVTATRHALPEGQGWSAVGDELLTLVGFAGVVISASIILFDYVWYD